MRCVWGVGRSWNVVRLFPYQTLDVIVEIRNPGLLGPDYHKVLASHGVAHVYNHWGVHACLG